MCQRERLAEYTAAHVQYIQKALTEMALQLEIVASGIKGATGKWIICPLSGLNAILKFLPPSEMFAAGH